MELRGEPFHADGATWDGRVAGLPDAHLLQTWEWAQVKAKYGWQLMPMAWSRPGSAPGEDAEPVPAAMAMVLKRRIRIRRFPTPISVLYVPKGPLLAWSDVNTRTTVLDDLQAIARAQQAVFIKIDPDVQIAQGGPGGVQDLRETAGEAVREDLQLRGWVYSGEQVQFRNTVMLDLAPSEDELLARMKQKTRYNVRLASRKGVEVRQGTIGDLPLLYKLYAETSRRDGFAIRDQAYYENVWTRFLDIHAARDVPRAELLVGHVDGEIAAAVFLFFFAERAYYLYGMSGAAHRDKMPNHLLQWEAIKLAKRRGCRVYDLWGAPDEMDGSDPLWGVYRFKEGFGGRVVRTMGAWDYPTSKVSYGLYTRGVPRLMKVMRWLGRRRVERDLLAA
jgi:lipid II:glycine glycyltransferase (peptidoglycan interpeptide bridge formation enzyme)